MYVITFIFYEYANKTEFQFMYLELSFNFYLWGPIF